MADPVSLHSRVVFWLKIAFPLAALAILSTLFLLGRDPVPDGTSPISGVNVKDLAERPRLTNAEYSGVTSDGASMTVHAEEARPGATKADGATATGVHAQYDREDGYHFTVTSDQGALAPDGEVIDLMGNVVTVTSDGYTLKSDALTVALKRTRVTSDTPVTVDAPFGTIRAGAMTIAGGEGPQGHDVLVFNRGVHLIYDPVKASGTGP